jgi:hypothetical protein
MKSAILFISLLIPLSGFTAQASKIIEKPKDIFYVLGVNTELSSMLSGYQFAYQESPKVTKIEFVGNTRCYQMAEIMIQSKSIGEAKERMVKLEVKKPRGCYIIGL